ncbi:unnamed protein product [Ectocarpus sp. 6 AP-2014]
MRGKARHPGPKRRRPVSCEHANTQNSIRNARAPPTGSSNNTTSQPASRRSMHTILCKRSSVQSASLRRPAFSCPWAVSLSLSPTTCHAAYVWLESRAHARIGIQQTRRTEKGGDPSATRHKEQTTPAHVECEALDTNKAGGVGFGRTVTASPTHKQLATSFSIESCQSGDSKATIKPPPPTHPPPQK